MDHVHGPRGVPKGLDDVVHLEEDIRRRVARRDGHWRVAVRSAGFECGVCAGTRTNVDSVKLDMRVFAGHVENPVKLGQHELEDRAREDDVPGASSCPEIQDTPLLSKTVREDVTYRTDGVSSDEPV